MPLTPFTPGITAVSDYGYSPGPSDGHSPNTGSTPGMSVDSDVLSGEPSASPESTSRDLDMVDHTNSCRHCGQTYEKAYELRYASHPLFD
jgi:hypothetical protein